jgi:hypothetical protein
MKTAIFAIFATFTTACAGQAFTTAEEAMRLPDVQPTVVVAVSPDSEPAQQPDAGPTAAPDASPAIPAPDADTPEPDASPAAVEPPDAGSTQPDAAPEPDAAPVSTPTVLCDSVAQARLFVASTSEVDFAAGVGTVTMKRITLTDQAGCSASVAVSPMGAQGEFEVVSDCGALNPGESCTMTVTFLPTSTGRSVASWETNILGQQASFTAVGVGE